MKKTCWKVIVSDAEVACAKATGYFSLRVKAGMIRELVLSFVVLRLSNLRKQ